MTRPARVLGGAQRFQQFAEGDVVFQNHVAPIAGRGAVVPSADALDCLAVDGFGHGIIAVFLIALVVVGVGNVVEEKRFLGTGLALEEGLCFAQVHGADLGKIPIRRGEDAALAVPEPNPAHSFTVGKGPAIVANVNARLGVERILGVAGHSKEFIEAMMRRAIEHGPREVDILVVVIGGRFARAVIECHTHMIFTDSRRAIAARLQHLRQRAERALDHGRVRSVR